MQSVIECEPHLQKTVREMDGWMEMRMKRERREEPSTLPSPLISPPARSLFVQHAVLFVALFGTAAFIQAGSIFLLLIAA